MKTLNRHGRSRSYRQIGRFALLIGGVLLLAWPASLVDAVSPVVFTYLQAVNAPGSLAPDATAIADLNGDGKPDLVVANHDNGTVNVLLGRGDGTFRFAPGSPIILPGANAAPVALALADLNGDGKKDLVVANQDGNSISVLLGVGTGAFTAVGSPIPIASPTDVALGDLDGDGIPDLVVTDSAFNTVHILRGNGTGAFTAFGAAIAVGTAPTAVALGDLNGDGHLDLAVADNGDFTLSVLLGNGSGAFAAAPGSPISFGYSPYAVAIGDLNGDGHRDIVVVTASPRGRVYSLLGVGNGTFAAPVASPLFSFEPYTSVAIVNFGGDAFPDLLVSGTESEGVVDVLHGVGDGTFTYSISTDRLIVDNNPTGVAAADFTGDGKLDFLVANTGDNTISVFSGNGGGTFTRISPAPPIASTLGYPFSSVVVADFNRDGKMDLAVDYGSSKLSILLGDGLGTFTPTPASPVTVFGSILVTGDFNGDGKTDLASLGAGGGSLYILIGNGDGTFNAPITTSPSGGTFWTTIAADDLNGDGKTDLAVGDLTANTVTPLISTGAGAFTILAPIPVGRNPADVEIADLNGDNKADIVVTNPTDNTVTILLNNGGTPVTFTQAPGSPIAVGMSPRQVVIADLNGDGKKDLAVANLNDNTVSVLLGVGNGAFTAAPGSPVATAVGNNGVLAVGDLNGDGIPDLAIPAAAADGYIAVLTGNGNGSFTANGAGIGGSPNRLADGAAHRFTLADVNGDGKRDIIAVGFNISVLLNRTVLAPPIPAPAPSPRPGPPPSGGPPSPAPPPRPGPPPSGGPPRPIPTPRT